MPADRLPGGVDQFPIVRAAFGSASGSVSAFAGARHAHRADYHLTIAPPMEGYVETEDNPRVSIAEAIEVGLAAPSETVLEGRPLRTTGKVSRRSKLGWGRS